MTDGEFESDRSTGEFRAAHDPYSTLRIPEYRRYLLAMLAAGIGAEMRDLAIGWELYERTGSFLALGAVGLALIIPVLLLALPAGHLSDSLSRVRVILAGEILITVSAVVLACVSYFSGPIIIYYGCLILIGIAGAISRPARWAVVPQLVPNSLVSNAVTWSSTGWQVAAIAGPALAGRLIESTGTACWVYLCEAACAIAAIVSLAGLETPPARVEREPLTWASMAAGFSFVARSRLILATLTLDLFAVLLGGAVTLLPVYSRDILRLTPAGLGWLRAATPLGAFVMSLILNQRRPMTQPGRSLLYAVAGFGMATIVFGLSTDPMLSFAMLFLIGAFDNISVVVRATIVQVLTPDTMRGRVSAVNGIFIGASNELGGFESGLVARLFGPVVAVVSGGVGSILVVLGVAWIWPEVARLGSLTKLGAADAERSVEGTGVDSVG
ncbi:MAG: MFS transporter [Isosphaeraceae bacterium]|nr:MFS transporter [Isosphaeraceae bacterium]